MKSINVSRNLLQIIVCLLFVCSGISLVRAQSSTDIAGVWKYKSVKDRHGSVVKEVGQADSLNLRENGTFYYFLQKEQIFATGVWIIEQDSLVLRYHPFPLPINCTTKLTAKDTLVYLKDGEVICKKVLPTAELYYLDKTPEDIFKEIIVKANSGVQMKIRTYAIVEQSKKKLVIKENTVNFTFKR